MSGPGLQGTNTKLELSENIPVWEHKINNLKALSLLLSRQIQTFPYI